MNVKMPIWKNILFWIVALLIMVSSAVYQRITGPTHPYRGTVELHTKEEVSYRLLRSNNTDSPAPVNIIIPNRDITGKVAYKRYKSFDEWHLEDMTRSGDTLHVNLPQLPAAGKIMYYFKLGADEDTMVKTPSDPVILRYKDPVPGWALVPHIILIFIAMVFSTRTGIEGLANGKRVYSLTVWTTILFVLGGFIFGPIVQKFAFGAYWTGFPFGHDLTDNKVLFSLIFWLIALWRIPKCPEGGRWWAVAASVSLLIIYLIPHSLLGSEIDFRELEGQL
jgi:hypothetical protein